MRIPKNITMLYVTKSNLCIMLRLSIDRSPVEANCILEANSMISSSVDPYFFFIQSRPNPSKDILSDTVQMVPRSLQILLGASGLHLQAFRSSLCRTQLPP